MPVNVKMRTTKSMSVTFTMEEVADILYQHIADRPGADEIELDTLEAKAVLEHQNYEEVNVTGIELTGCCTEETEG